MFLLFQKYKIKKFPHPKAFHDPSLSLFSLSNGSCGNFSFQSNGFFILHEPMGVKNDLTFKWNLG